LELLTYVKTYVAKPYGNHKAFCLENRRQTGFLIQPRTASQSRTNIWELIVVGIAGVIIGLGIKQFGKKSYMRERFDKELPSGYVGYEKD